MGVETGLNRTFLYFAYGSNMLAPRIERRCPSARMIGRASAAGYRLVWDKAGRDGSGKAGMIPDPESLVEGVLYEIAADERRNLDVFEDAVGDDPGYRPAEDFAFDAAAGGKVRALAYLPVAARRRPGLLPYDWYKALVVAGAVQHAFPADYVAQLESVAAISDPETGLPKRGEALDVLRAAGFDFPPAKIG
jgi:hypothetical protein